MKFKPGQKVRIKEKFWELPNPYGYEQYLQNKRNLAGKVLVVEGLDENGFFTSNESLRGKWYWNFEWATPLEKTLDDLEKGDILVNDNDKTFYKVKARLEDIIFLSFPAKDLNHRNLEIVGQYRTIGNLKDFGYNVYQPEQLESPKITEMTVAEIAEKLGLSGELRIKE